MMSPLWQQLQALRTPTELKIIPGEELDYHISNNVIPFLQNLPTKNLVSSDDKGTLDLLDFLDPSIDTLSYLYVLDARFKVLVDTLGEQTFPHELDQDGRFLQKFLSFLASFDSLEIRYAGSKWRELMNVFNVITQFGKASHIMGNMAKAMLRLDPSLGTFTSTHLLFVRLCLQSGSFNAARPVLEHDCHSFPIQDCPPGTVPCSTHFNSNEFITIQSKLSSKVTLHDVLEYHLLGAMIYIGLQDWASATHHLEHVLSTPTNNVAHVLMLEAYKKWLLIGLLANGKCFPLPKTANGPAIKTIKSAARPYEIVVEAFKQEDSRKLYAEIDEAQSVWTEDGNASLIRHVLGRHRELSVVRLGNIYLSIPLNMLTQRLNMSLNETRNYIESLISRGRLHAKLDRSLSLQGKAVLRFLTAFEIGQSVISEDQLATELAQQTKKMVSLAQSVTEADRRLSLTREYLDHVLKSRKAAEHDRSSPEQEGMDVPLVTSAVSDEEESVMEDVG